MRPPSTRGSISERLHAGARLTLGPPRRFTIDLRALHFTAAALRDLQLSLSRDRSPPFCESANAGCYSIVSEGLPTQELRIVLGGVLREDTRDNHLRSNKHPPQVK